MLVRVVNFVLQVVWGTLPSVVIDSFWSVFKTRL